MSAETSGNETIRRICPRLTANFYALLGKVANHFVFRRVTSQRKGTAAFPTTVLRPNADYFLQLSETTDSPFVSILRFLLHGGGAERVARSLGG